MTYFVLLLGIWVSGHDAVYADSLWDTKEKCEAAAKAHTTHPQVTSTACKPVRVNK